MIGFCHTLCLIIAQNDIRQHEYIYVCIYEYIHVYIYEYSESWLIQN